MEKLNEELQQKVDKEFDNFWKDIVCDENGCLDLEKVKRELYDYSLAMKYVSEVYCELTNGHISKIHADPQIVIRMVYEQIQGLEMIFIGAKNETNEQVNSVGVASN